MDIEERYETETVSHSGLMALEGGPVSYRKYKERQDTSTKGMNLGSAIHCEVLEPSEFNGRYMVSKYAIPTGKNATFVEELYRTRKEDCLLHVTDKFEEHWVHNAWIKSELKGTPAKAWEAFTADSDTGTKLQLYWDYLEESEGKFKLDPSDVEIIAACKSSIQNHKAANELMFGNALLEVHEELDIVWEHPDFGFKMRSIIDKLIIDKEAKTIIMADLKTSAKNIHKFIEPYEMYGYYRQLPLYEEAVAWYIKNELGYDCADWTIKSYIVAVQTTGNHECAVYAPSRADKAKGHKATMKALDTMDWHFKHDKWDYPRDYYLGDGIITLRIDGEDTV